MYSKHFFENYGRLVYAVAAIDGDIAGRERSTVASTLDAVSKMHEEGISDDFKAGLWLSKIVFQKAAELKLHPSRAVSEFEHYWKNARHLVLSTKEAEICIGLLQHLAQANHGVDASEREILEKSISMLKEEKTEAE